MRGGCVSETEIREEKHREAAASMSNNELAWAGFALTEFVLIVSIFTAFKVETDIFFQMTIAITIICGLLFVDSWSLFQSAGSAHRLRLKIRKQGKLRQIHVNFW
jgi:hypothetical protein